MILYYSSEKRMSEVLIPAFYVALGAISMYIYQHYQKGDYNKISLTEDQKRLQYLYNQTSYNLSNNYSSNISRIKEEIEIIEKRINNHKYLLVICKCLVCNNEISSYKGEKICQDCILPAVMEFHAKARFEKDKINKSSVLFNNQLLDKRDK
jgi:hypothetical protein